VAVADAHDDAIASGGHRAIPATGRHPYTMTNWCERIYSYPLLS